METSEKLRRKSISCAKKKKKKKTQTKDAIQTRQICKKRAWLQDVHRLPGLNSLILLSMPEKATSFSIFLEEPSLMSRRETQLVTLLHQPPPYKHMKASTKTI